MGIGRDEEATEIGGQIDGVSVDGVHRAGQGDAGVEVVGRPVAHKEP
jgi:hypothetical protein